jgi:hypothetical protein
MNCSPNDVPVQLETEFVGGYAITYPDNVPANEVSLVGFAPKGKTEITFGGLPTGNGYLYGSFMQIVPLDEVSPEFFKV